MRKKLFRGVATALVTPFTADGQLDIATLQRLLTWQLEQGADALVLCGTTGESAVLSDAEKQQLLEVAVRVCGGRCPVIAGVGSNDTAHTVRLARMAAGCGVDGLLVVTPYYNKTTQAGAAQHYEAVAAATPLPILLYNVPSRTGMDLVVETILRLAELPTVAGIKEACGRMDKIARLCAEAPADFAVYAGNDAETLPVLALGGDGVVSVTSNLVPAALHELCQAFFAADLLRAHELQKRLTPLHTLLFSSLNPLHVKALMEAVGLPCGDCRLPLEQLNPAYRAALLQKARPLLRQFAAN